MGRRRGSVQYEGIPEQTPPGMSIPKKVPKGLAASGTGSVAGTTPSTKYVELQWDVTGAGSTMWVAGAGITVKELDDFNAVAAPTGYSLPGSSADDNNWQVPFVMPAGYDSTRSVEVTLTIVQESS